MKKCPYCAEEIQDEAIKCRYCGEPLVDEMWRAFCKRYQSLPKKKKDKEWKKLGENERKEFRAAWAALGYDKPEAAPSQVVIKKEKKQTSVVGVGCLVLLLVVLFTIIMGDFGTKSPPATKRTTSPTPGTSRPSPAPPPPPVPSFRLKVTSCSRSYDYLTTEGYVENTGKVTVHFVEVTTKWEDSGGQVVDTGWTYAVGSEFLRPGERSTFTGSTQHARAQRCTAQLKDYKIVR